MSSSEEYTTVSLPRKITNQIDDLIKNGIGSYSSRAEFIKEAIRMRFEQLKTTMPIQELPSLEHFNLDEHGVRILDRTLATKTSNGRIIDVYFQPDKILCAFDDSSNCRHIKFALELPDVKKILNQKGWTAKTQNR